MEPSNQTTTQDRRDDVRSTETLQRDAEDRYTVNRDVPTWRERICVAPDYPLHVPSIVERAMVAEIAELRQLIQKGTK